MSPRERAAGLLRHYLSTAFRGAGLVWDGDHDSEVEQLFDAIERMIADAVQAHADDAPHLYSDGSAR